MPQLHARPIKVENVEKGMRIFNFSGDSRVQPRFGKSILLQLSGQTNGKMSWTIERHVFFSPGTFRVSLPFSIPWYQKSIDLIDVCPYLPIYLYFNGSQMHRIRLCTTWVYGQGRLNFIKLFSWLYLIIQLVLCTHSQKASVTLTMTYMEPKLHSILALCLPLTAVIFYPMFVILWLFLMSYCSHM